MPSASAYILKVPPNRRDTLLRFLSDEERIGEPVPRFDHSRSVPLVVLACFSDNAVTHIADGRKGVSSGTGLVRLNMERVEALDEPVPLSALVEAVPSRVRHHVRRFSELGGKLPPKSLGAVVDALLHMRPGLRDRLVRFSEERAALIAGMSDTAKANLAVQKETLTTALEVAGIGRDEVLKWSAETQPGRSFLEGLPQAQVREDAAIIADFSTLPGFDVIRNLPFAVRVFRNEMNPAVELKVIMANRLPLEEQTGADLIYYNERYQSFVLVQSKMMERHAGDNELDSHWEFRWRDGDQLAREVSRMSDLLARIRQEAPDSSPASFRLHDNPFFLKLCRRLVFDPDDKGLFKGMYLPLDYWRTLAGDASTIGPRGGRILTFDNVQRKLSNDDFVKLVSDAWIGTTVSQSNLLRDVIEAVVQNGRTVTLAVKSERPEVANGSSAN